MKAEREGKIEIDPTILGLHEVNRVASNCRRLTSTISFMPQIQFQGLRLEPKLPRLLQTEHQANPAGNRGCERLDLENTVLAERVPAWRSSGKFSFIQLSSNQKRLL